MSRQRWLIGGFLLAALAVALFRPADSVSAAPPEERTFERDGAVRVTRKGPSESYFLAHAKSVRVGDRGFLYGWKIGGTSAVYIPVSEIELIEEFSSVEALKKAYKLGEPEVVREKTTTEKEKTPPDKEKR
jgi:hypothetical protein